MVIAAIVIGAVIVLLFAGWLGWRLLNGRWSVPCPASLAGVLQNPFTARYHRAVLARLELVPGLRVLDAGCGPGLLSTAIAAAVAPDGRVLSVDIQPSMIAKTRARAEKAGITNIDYLVAPLGAGQLPVSVFDRALLVTVLGEIPNKVAALNEVRSALKPGGFLSITEVLLDPDYQSLGKVLRLADRAGLRFRNKAGSFFVFTVNLERPFGA